MPVGYIDKHYSLVWQSVSLSYYHLFRNDTLSSVVVRLKILKSDHNITEYGYIKLMDAIHIKVQHFWMIFPKYYRCGFIILVNISSKCKRAIKVNLELRYKTPFQHSFTYFLLSWCFHLFILPVSSNWRILFSFFPKCAPKFTMF